MAHIKLEKNKKHAKIACDEYFEELITTFHPKFLIRVD